MTCPCGREPDPGIKPEGGCRCTGYTFRRRDLIRWLKERPAHDGLTAAEIADVSGIYDGHGRYDRCIGDLKHFAQAGQVWRDNSRPSRWFA